MPARYAIVGSGIAAVAAAEAVRGRDPRARITMVSAEAHPFYSRPGLAYLLRGDIPEQQLAVRAPDDVRALDLERVTATAASVNCAAREVVLDDGTRVPYDRLLLATGAAAVTRRSPAATCSAW